MTMLEFSNGADLRAHYKTTRAKFFQAPDKIVQFGRVYRLVPIEADTPVISEEPEPVAIPIFVTPEPEPIPEAELPANRHPVMKIIKAVADLYGVTVPGILSERRNHDILNPRHVAMYCAYNMIEKTTITMIGQKMGKDHTTVLNGIDRVERLRAFNPMMQSVIDAVRAQFA